MVDTAGRSQVHVLTEWALQGESGEDGEEGWSSTGLCCEEDQQQRACWSDVATLSSMSVYRRRKRGYGVGTGSNQGMNVVRVFEKERECKG